MPGFRVFFSMLFFPIIIMPVMGCESPSSSPPQHLFAPDRLALAPNPDDPAGQILYAGNPLTGPAGSAGAAPSNSTITVVDLPSEAPRASPIIVGGILQDIAVSRDGRRLFVTKLDGSERGLLVSYTTVGGFTEMSRVSAAGTPGEAALSPLGNSIYTLTTDPDALLAFSTTTFTQEALMPLGFTPTVLGVSPTGPILIGNPTAGTIEFFSDVSSLPLSIALGGRPEGVSFSPDGSVVYVTVSSPPRVLAIDLSGTFLTIASVPLSGAPGGIAVAVTTSTLVFVADANGTVYVVDFSSGTIVVPLAVGGIPRQVVISPDGSRAYISDSLNNAIAVIDTGKLQSIKTIK